MQHQFTYKMKERFSVNLELNQFRSEFQRGEVVTAGERLKNSVSQMTEATEKKLQATMFVNYRFWWLKL